MSKVEGGGYTREPGEQTQLIELRHGRLRALVNPQGAYMNELSINRDGQDIPLLFPRIEVLTPEGPAVRGGSHVCLPVFGPSEHLDKHGFGRDVEWTPAAQNENGVSLLLDVNEASTARGAKYYDGLCTELDYAIHDDPEFGPPMLLMTLTIVNDGFEPMTILPGFHPYLARGEETDPVAEVSAISGGAGTTWFHRYTAEELATPSTFPYIGDGSREIDLGGRIVRLQTKMMPTTRLWSDKASDFVCFEPTVDGNLTADNHEASLLEPMEHSRYRAALTWTSI